MSTETVRSTYWWGEPWPSADLRADMCDDDRFRIPVPVGEPCYLCGELIMDADRGTTAPGYIGAGEPDASGNPTAVFVPEPLHAHHECGLRTTQGCSARLLGHPCDHTGSYREDALKVWKLLTGESVEL